MKKDEIHHDILKQLNTNISLQEKLLATYEAVNIFYSFINRIAIALYDNKTLIFKTFISSSDIKTPLKHYETKLSDAPSLKKIIKTKDHKRFIVHFVDSDLLEEDLPYIFHFYIISGIVEAKFAQFFDMKVKCDVLDYKTLKEDKEN